MREIDDTLDFLNEHGLIRPSGGSTPEPGDRTPPDFSLSDNREILEINWVEVKRKAPDPEILQDPMTLEDENVLTDLGAADDPGLHRGLSGRAVKVPWEICAWYAPIQQHGCN